MVVKHFVEASSYQLHVQLHEISISSIAIKKFATVVTKCLLQLQLYIYSCHTWKC